MPTIEADLFKEKVRRILSATYGGMHHVPGKLKFDIGSSFQMAEINISGDLATFDFGRLTCLVLGAHKERIRIEINPCNMQYLKLRFHPRLEDGPMSQRHPTIEQAIARFEENYA